MTAQEQILQSIRSRKPHPKLEPHEYEQDNAILEFCTHPLMSIYCHTQLHSTLDYTSYEGVFEDEFKLLDFLPDTDFDETREYVDKIIKYFSEELTWKRVLGGHLYSEWENELKSFLQLGSTNACKRKHIAMFCKLPAFYKNAIEFDTKYIENECKPIKVSEEMYQYQNMETELKYLYKTKKHTKRDRKQTYFYFTDKNNQLYEVKQPKNSAMESMFELMWGDSYKKIETTAKVKEKLSTGANYFYCEWFRLIS